MQLVVGRIARAHGVSGEVSVEVRTDEPDLRFAVGNDLATDPAEAGPLTVEATRWHSGRLLIRFAGIGDRSAADALRGTMLVADSASSPPLSGDDEYWDHDLVGLAVQTPDGLPLGEVTEVLHPPGSDLLAIRAEDGREILVPFVREMVPVVDVAAGRVVVDPPEGLLEL